MGSLSNRLVQAVNRIDMEHFCALMGKARGSRSAFCMANRALRVGTAAALKKNHHHFTTRSPPTLIFHVLSSLSSFSFSLSLGGHFPSVGFQVRATWPKPRVALDDNPQVARCALFALCGVMSWSGVALHILPRRGAKFPNGKWLALAHWPWSPPHASSHAVPQRACDMAREREAQGERASPNDLEHAGFPVAPHAAPILYWRSVLSYWKTSVF